jgi:serine/threonine-protein kinase
MTPPDPLEPDGALEPFDSALADLELGLEAGFGPAPDPLVGLRPSVIEILASGPPRVSLREPPSQLPGPPPLAAGEDTGALPPHLGKYQLRGEVARGGIGLVLKGNDPRLGRDVAIKVLHEQHRDNSALVERFIEEAQIGGQLEHPGIVPVYELGAEDGRPFFAMKLVNGRTLAALLAERRSPADDLRRFLAVFERVAQTMAYAHARGVIHRDLKPTNIMVGAFGEVQVVDWGLAKVLGAPGSADGDAQSAAARTDAAPRTVRSKESSSHSVAGSVMGTPAYMPPEQAKGEVARLDERCDVFALGAILCEVLTGAAPYASEDRDEVLRLAAAAELADAQRRLAACGADAELVALANDCLRPAVELRPRSAEEVAERLSRHLAAVEARAQEARVSAAEERVKAHAARRAQRLTIGLAASVVATVLLGGGGWLWVARDREERAAAAARTVQEALTEAEQLRGKAKASPAGELVAWTEALAAAGKARSLAAAAGISGEIEARVAAMLAVLHEEEALARKLAAQRRADEGMRARLESISIPADAAMRGGDLDMAGCDLAESDAERRDAAYREAFLGYGIDLEGLSDEQLAARVAETAIAAELAVALDDWAFARRELGPADSSSWKLLLSIAAAADPDPLRKRLRDALHKDDWRAEDLKGVLGGAELSTVPPLTLHLLGKTLMNTGAIEDAAALLEEAQRLHPGYFNLNLDLATTMIRRQPPDWKEAIRYYSAALAVRPENREAEVSLAWAHWSEGQAAQATATLRDVVRRQPDYAYAWMVLGEFQRCRGQPADAITSCREALRVQPQFAQGYHALGLALFHRGRRDEAVQVFRDALRLEPDMYAAHCDLANTLKSLGRADEASRAFDAAVLSARGDILRKPGSPLAHYRLGEALRGKRDLKGAIEAYRAASRVRTDDPWLHFRLGQVLWQEWDRPETDEGMLEEAIKNYRVSVRLRPEREAMGGLGYLLRKAGRFDESIEVLRELLRRCPEATGTYETLADALREKGELEPALEAYEKALRHSPRDGDIWCNIGRVKLRLGRCAEAAEAWARAHEFDPRHPFWAYLNTVGFEKVRPLVAELCVALPAYLEGREPPAGALERLVLAKICFEKELHAKAASLFQSVFALDPSLGRADWCLGRWEAANSAALAGCGESRDAAGLDAAARAALRRQALAWLREDLERAGRLLAETKRDRRAIQRTLLRSLNLRGVRLPERLAELPEAEREEWQAYWEEMRRVVRGAGA